MLRDYDRKITELISVDDFESHELGAQAERDQSEGVDEFPVPSGQVA
jgi:hypothetical protein